MDPSVNPPLWADRLLEIGIAVQRRVIEVMRAGGDLIEPVAEKGGDVIYPLDVEAEDVIQATIESWPDEFKPLLLIAEGLGEAGRKPFGAAAGPFRCRLLVDPVDGTRNLMYDKRSGWFVAAAAPDRGPDTTLADALAAVIVELPTTKQQWVDAFVAVQGQPASGRRTRLDGSGGRELLIHPSEAEGLAGGFAQVSNFFPGTKVLASELMERIAEATIGPLGPGQAGIFEDQYITTAGQMVELIVGHDRFCCDLRPLFYRLRDHQLGRGPHGLVCHPYDMAGLLVAQQAGVILTDGFGRPLRTPLDVSRPVHWCGYANAVLREKIEPVILRWLEQHGVLPG